MQNEQKIVKGLDGKCVEIAVYSNNLVQRKVLICNGHIPIDIKHVLELKNRK